MFEISTKYKVSSCPLDKPYADYPTDTCFQCPDKNAVFNLGNRQCYSCTGGTYLNESTSLCQTCPQFSHFNFTLKKCVECSANKVFNATTYEC